RRRHLLSRTGASQPHGAHDHRREFPGNTHRGWL
ncbi:uncharacterized protein METZ01_LOCUS483614, partial [marine metagenome]